MKYSTLVTLILIAVASIIFLSVHNKQVIPLENEYIEDIDYPEINNHWAVNSCTRSIPEGTFIPDTVTAHTFTLDTALGEGRETMILPDGTSLLFIDSGCEDIVHTFTFSLQYNSKQDLDDTTYWYDQAIRAMEKVVGLGNFAIDIRSGIDALDTYRIRTETISFGEILTPTNRNSAGGGEQMLSTVILHQPIDLPNKQVELSIEFSLGPL